MPGRQSRPGGCRSEEKLQRKLHQPRIAGLCDLAKLRAIRRVAVRVEELRVIKDVEDFRTEIYALVLGYPEGFQYGEIRVADMRAAANRARRISDPPKQARIDAGVLGKRR